MELMLTLQLQEGSNHEQFMNDEHSRRLVGSQVIGKRLQPKTQGSSIIFKLGFWCLKPSSFLGNE
jgi:hypothetical protein